MSDQEDLLRGMIRQIEREAAARELYLNYQIKQLKESNGAAFEAGWCAREQVPRLGAAIFKDCGGDNRYSEWKQRL